MYKRKVVSILYIRGGGGASLGSNNSTVIDQNLYVEQSVIQTSEYRIITFDLSLTSIPSGEICLTFSTAALTECSLCTSNGTANTFLLSTSFFSFSAPSGLRAEAITMLPLAASCSTSSKPIPLELPVIKYVRGDIVMGN